MIIAMNTLTPDDLAAISESFDMWTSHFRAFTTAFYDANHASAAIRQVWDKFLGGVLKRYPDISWKAACIALEEQWTVYLGQHAKIEERNQELERILRSDIRPEALTLWTETVAMDRVKTGSAARRKELALIACAILKKIEMVADDLREKITHQEVVAESGDELETEGWKDLRSFGKEAVLRE